MTAVRMGNPNVIQVRSLTANILLAEESFLLPSYILSRDERKQKQQIITRKQKRHRETSASRVTTNFLD